VARRGGFLRQTDKVAHTSPGFSLRLARDARFFQFEPLAFRKCDTLSEPDVPNSSRRDVFFQPPCPRTFLGRVFSRPAPPDTFSRHLKIVPDYLRRYFHDDINAQELSHWKKTTVKNCPEVPAEFLHDVFYHPATPAGKKCDILSGPGPPAGFLDDLLKRPEFTSRVLASPFGPSPSPPIQPGVVA
jgi:hypothetical protein